MAPTPIRVAFQGEPGAYSELAIREWYGDDALLVPCPTFRAALQAVQRNAADAAVLPIENVIVGDIEGALEAIDTHAVGLDLGDTIDVPVEHCLLAVRGVSLGDLRTVRSHPAALAQCAEWLRRHGLAAEEAEDTAGSARQLAASGETTVGAIASALAAERYGLVILARDIADRPGNRTRFVRLQRAD